MELTTRSRTVAGRTVGGAVGVLIGNGVSGGGVIPLRTSALGAGGT